MAEINKEEIRAEAKAILDKFASALEKVKLKEKVEKKETGGYRKEAQGKKCDESFRKAMFENFRIKDSDSARKSDEDFRHAPQKDEDCIIAEKKSW